MERAKQVLIGEEREYTVEYEHGDTMWFVIDTDKWEEQGKIAPLREFCSQQNASISDALDEVKTYQAWNVAQSNPSFEIWLYYHIYDKKPDTEDVEKCASFKAFLTRRQWIVTTFRFRGVFAWEGNWWLCKFWHQEIAEQN